ADRRRQRAGGQRADDRAPRRAGPRPRTDGPGRTPPPPAGADRRSAAGATGGGVFHGGPALVV
ncbi:Diaminohydroxyphosphoribosylaminopyrimidinedeaminase (EC 3.5.4.26) / 5-amino-6-(5-phosphoribosylamino)uracil reductase (EC 1.1.1.193), partial [Pseudomonas sp. FEN]